MSTSFGWLLVTWFLVGVVPALFFWRQLNKPSRRAFIVAFIFGVMRPLGAIISGLLYSSIKRSSQ